MFDGFLVSYTRIALYIPNVQPKFERVKSIRQPLVLKTNRYIRPKRNSPLLLFSPHGHGSGSKIFSYPKN